MPALKNVMRPVHPGEVLREEYLAPMGMSANALAQAIGVPANRVSAIVAGKRSVTADTALRLARALGTTPAFWLNLQQSYELRLAEQDKETAAAIREIRRVAGSHRRHRASPRNLRRQSESSTTNAPPGSNTRTAPRSNSTR